MKKIVILSLLILSINMKAQIVAWQFGSPASLGSEATYNATTNDANLNISVLSRGTGITATALARGFSATGYPFSTNTKVDAISNNRYFAFSVSAKSNYKVSLSAINARLRRSSSGPNAYIWRYSTDGTNFTDIGTDISFTSTIDGVDQAQISLSGITSLQNIPNGTIIYFRLYAWGAITNSTGTFAIARYTAGVTTNCLSIEGTVASLGGLTPPTLTADNTLNNVDNNIDISFTDDITWRGLISAVKIGGTTLTPTTDYILSEGNIQLNPSGLNSLLTTSGSKTITIEATGYTPATVTQEINAGAPTSNSTASINIALATNTTRTITCTAKDQYNNNVSGYTFKYDLSITNSDLTTTESYTIDGTARSSSVYDVNVVATTNASGVATFTSVIPASIDANDGLSIQLQLNNGSTNVGSAFAFTKVPAQITLTGIDPNSNYLNANSNNNVLYRIAVAVATDVTSLSSVNVTFAGNYTSSDINATGLKIWYSNDNIFSSGSDIELKAVSSSAIGTGEVVNFTELNYSFGIGTGYLFVTTDISSGASLTKTISCSVNSNNDLSFTGSPTFSGSSFGTANLHTIISANLLMIEDFNFSGLISSNGWNAYSGAGTAAINTTTGLTYSDYTGSGIGNAAALTANGEDDSKSFSITNSGTLYASFLVNVTSASSTGDYCFILAENTTTFCCKVFIKKDALTTKFAIGLSKTAAIASANFTGFDYDPSTTYLVVVKYTFNTASTTDDEVKLWVNPSISGSEPTSTLTSTDAGTDANNLSLFILRQTSNTPVLSVDGIRVATTWADVPLPVELNSFGYKNIGKSVNLKWETKSEINSSEFMIERKLESSDWNKIGTVKAAGNSNAPINYSFIDNNLKSGKIQYRLKMVDVDGSFEYSKVIETEIAVPKEFSLSQNYPNPFNPSTVIEYQLPVDASITLSVYNLTGEKIADLVNEEQSAGYHTVNFSASETGKNLTSGVYFYRMNAVNKLTGNSFSSVKKMLIMK